MGRMKLCSCVFLRCLVKGYSLPWRCGPGRGTMVLSISRGLTVAQPLKLRT